MPKHTLAYHGLAEVYVKQQRIEKAVNVYQKITALDPDDKDARTALKNLGRKVKGEQTKR